MKKALDYVSDYQLKSACKDAICIPPSKVTQMIFAVLEDRYHHIVLTHGCKLVSFFYIMLVNAQQLGLTLKHTGYPIGLQACTYMATVHPCKLNRYDFIQKSLYM